MANIIITGNSVSVISEIKLEDIKTVAKYRPEALNLYEGEGKDKTLAFVVRAGNTPSMGAYGVAFTSETSEGNAVVTEIFAGQSATTIKDAVAEKYGVGILNLRKLELTLPAVLEEIKSQREEIKSAIEVW